MVLIVCWQLTYARSGIVGPASGGLELRRVVDGFDGRGCRCTGLDGCSDPSNTLSTITLGDSVVEPGEAFYPQSVAVSPTGANAGNIYVGSYNNSTVTVLSPNGTILDTIAANRPTGIAIAP